MLGNFPLWDERPAAAAAQRRVSHLCAVAAEPWGNVTRGARAPPPLMGQCQTISHRGPQGYCPMRLAVNYWDRQLPSRVRAIAARKLPSSNGQPRPAPGLGLAARFEFGRQAARCWRSRAFQAYFQGKRTAARAARAAALVEDKLRNQRLRRCSLLRRADSGRAPGAPALR